MKYENYGAFLVQDKFLNDSEMQAAIDVAQQSYAIKKPTWGDDSALAGIKWFSVDLPGADPVVKKFSSKYLLDESSIKMSVIYYLDPGAKIHPHRDITGAALNNRIRFHIPIVTNEKIRFLVDKKIVKMQPGSLWCLDTSYLHSVENLSEVSRSHIVLECEMNSEIKALLPRDLKSYAHSVEFFLWGVYKATGSLFYNFLFNRSYFYQQIGVLKRQVKFYLRSK